MEDKRKKIAEFLEEIIDNSLPPEQQIMLFSQDENIDGAYSENSGCTNKASTCKGSTNNTCKNHGDNCNNSNNTDCTALNTGCETNGDLCSQLNLFLGCGGQKGDS